jgi:hypothetical protein
MWLQKGRHLLRVLGDVELAELGAGELAGYVAVRLGEGMTRHRRGPVRRRPGPATRPRSCPGSTRPTSRGSATSPRPCAAGVPDAGLLLRRPRSPRSLDPDYPCRGTGAGSFPGSWGIL